MRFSARSEGDDDDHDGRDGEGRCDGAQSQSALRVRLGERVSKGGAKGACEHVSGPEEHALRDRGEKVGSGDQRDQAGEDECSTFETKAGGRSGEIAQGRAERVGDEDGEPVEDLVGAGGDVVNSNLAGHEVPDEQNDENRGEEHQGGFDVAEAERAVEIIRSRSAHGSGSYDYGPVEGRVVAPGGELGGEGDSKESEQDDAAHGIAQLQRHGEGVAAGLADGGRKNFDEPEDQRDLRDFTERLCRTPFGCHNAQCRILPCLASNNSKGRLLLLERGF